MQIGKLHSIDISIQIHIISKQPHGS